MRLLRTILCTALIAGSAIFVNAAPANASSVACQSLASKYQALIPPANSINILSASLFVIGQGPLPVIVNGLNGISSELTADVNGGVLCLPSDTADFNNLTNVSSQLFDVLIGKTGLLANVVFILAPLRSTYISLEAAMDGWLAAADVTGDYAPSVKLQTLIEQTAGF
jgi:hypothetical protein